MSSFFVEFFFKNFDEETRALLWRIFITGLLVGYIFWSNGIIDNTGHVSIVDFSNRVEAVDAKFHDISERLDETEDALADVDLGIRALRLESIRSNLFSVQAKLCELLSETNASPELVNVYENQTLNLWADYRNLGGGEYPLKPCTGMRPNQ